MNALNKILQKQVIKHFGNLRDIPPELAPLLTSISLTYDHHEKDRKMMERSLELTSTEMKVLNNRLQEEAEENNEIILEKLNESLSLFYKDVDVSILGSTDYQKLMKVADLLKKSQKALMQSQDNLLQIVNLLPQAVFAKDKDGKFIFVNESYASLYGLPPEKLIGKTFGEIAPPNNDVVPIADADKEVLLYKESRIIDEFTFSDYKGIVRKYQVTKVPFHTANMEDAILSIALNVTEQLKAEVERKKIITNMMQRNNALEQFSYIVSHNLRAPLANILGIKDVLREPGISEEQKKFLNNSLFQSIEKLDVVVKDINQILQIEQQAGLKKELLKFSELIADIKLSVKNQIDIENVTFVEDFSEVDEIFTLKTYLYSILYNLITNSIKYRQPDNDPVINIRTQKLRDKIEVFIIDNGLGIDLNKNKEKLFGLYKRFHNHVDGKGMGLYMVKTQVESLGGKIGVSSEVNKGTKFKIELEP